MKTFIFAFFILLVSTVRVQASQLELQKIDSLLTIIRDADVKFVRNGKEYTSKEAFEHLSSKLKSAQNSWFAPKREKWTAALFIEKVASGSSVSGKPYLIRTKEGKDLEARVWLTEKLKEIESK